MAVLTAQQVYAAARGAGATHDEAVILTAIARHESGFRTDAFNGNSRTGDESYGIWQINMLGKMGPERRKTFGIADNKALFDPRVNAKAALAILRSQGWNAWSVYKNGAYKQALPEAREAGKVGDNWQSVARSLNQDFGGSTTGGVGDVLGPNGVTTASPMGGGGASAPPALPPNATPEQIEQYIRENYPQAAGFLDVPEVRDKLIQAAREGWTSTKLEAEIQSTTWWRTNGATTRQMFALKATDPAQYQALLSAKRAAMEPIVQSIGYVGDYSPFIEDALKYGWTDDEIRQRLAAGLRNQSQLMGLTQGSTVDVTADALMQIARNEYLLPLNRQDIEKWAIDIFAGAKTEEGFRDYLNRLTQGRFPGLVDMGVTPGQYFAPIRNIVAETLELQPADIDLLSNRFSSLLETSDGKGGFRPMTMSEAQQWARSQSAYRTTKGARDTAAEFAENLGQMFGAVA